MKVVHAANSASAGGAARAALRIHQAQRSAGLESLMFTADATPVDPHITTVRSRAEFRYAKEWLERRIIGLQRSSNPILHSPALLPGRAFKVLRDSDADVINLHWVNGGLLSIEQIGKLTQQRMVLWTLHDMWAFCGAEHLDDPGGTERWVSGYRKRVSGRRIDLDRLTWQRKRISWTDPAHIIAPSSWMADCVRSSALMSSWSVTVIPNPLDTKIFRPYDSVMARDLLGLPQDVPLLLFGAVGGTAHHHKGWDLLEKALLLVSGEIQDLEIVVLGQRTAPEIPGVRVPVHSLGHLQDDVTMALAYSAATSVVVPSRREAFGQVASESHACGTPVVAFATGGLLDIVDHQGTGYLATPFDVADLARGIRWTLTRELETGDLGRTARIKAVREWELSVIGRKYAACIGAHYGDHSSQLKSDTEKSGA